MNAISSLQIEDLAGSHDGLIDDWKPREPCDVPSVGVVYYDVHVHLLSTKGA